MNPEHAPKPTAGDRVVVRHGKWAGREGVLLGYVWDEENPSVPPLPEVALDKVGRRVARVVRVLVVDVPRQRVPIKMTPVPPVKNESRESHRRPQPPRPGRVVHDHPTRDKWWERAKCLGKDPEGFFPDPGQAALARAAKKVCRECLVRHQCLEDAMATNAVGVWGGTTERERREMRRRLDPAS